MASWQLVYTSSCFMVKSCKAFVLSAFFGTRLSRATVFAQDSTKEASLAKSFQNLAPRLFRDSDLSWDVYPAHAMWVRCFLHEVFGERWFCGKNWDVCGLWLVLWWTSLCLGLLRLCWQQSSLCFRPAEFRSRKHHRLFELWLVSQPKRTTMRFRFPSLEVDPKAAKIPGYNGFPKSLVPVRVYLYMTHSHL